MPVGHKDPCPCGSGRKYKHCHLQHDMQKSRNTTWIVAGAVGLVLIGVLYVVSGGGLPWSRGQGGSPSGASQPPLPGSVAAPGATPGGTPASGVESRDQSPLPGGATPQPWQFDAPRNRHWHPDHAHWHDGPPPDPSQRTTPPIAPAAEAADQSPLPGGAVPAPNYYDAAKNRYWSAEHAHWHPGRPPAAPGGTGGATNP